MRHSLRATFTLLIIATSTLPPATVLAASQSVPSSKPFVGVWTLGPSSAEAQQLDQLGVGWARVTAEWSVIQPQAETFQWASLDAAMVSASAGGKRHIFVAIRSNPAWAASSACRVTTDTERDRLARFVTALVRRYSAGIPDGAFAGKRVNAELWQLYNEPDNTSEAFDRQHGLGGCFATLDDGGPTDDGRVAYARMLETVGASVHGAAPSARIVSGGVVSGNYTDLANPSCPIESSCIFDRGFIAGVLRTLKQDEKVGVLDAIAVHYYSSQGAQFDDAGPDLLGRVDHLRQTMAEAGLDASEYRSIIVDEGSYTGPPRAAINAPEFELAQRDYLVRVLARAASSGVDLYLWFWLFDAGAGLGSDVTYGLLSADGKPKPAFGALQYFASLIASPQQLIGRVATSASGIEGYAFSLNDGRSLQIIWDVVDDAPVGYTPAGSVDAVYDPAGQPVAFNPDQPIQLGAEPRYVFLAPASVARAPQTLTIGQ